MEQKQLSKKSRTIDEAFRNIGELSSRFFFPHKDSSTALERAFEVNLKAISVSFSCLIENDGARSPSFEPDEKNLCSSKSIY